MTPLAQRFARELTLPLKQRKISDHAHVLERLDEMHCFDVSAIWESVNEALDGENMWPAIGGMLPGLFLPSPRTWLEIPYKVTIGTDGRPNGINGHLGLMIERRDGWFTIDLAMQDNDGAWSGPMGRVRAGTVLDVDRIEMDYRWGVDQAGEHGVNCQEVKGSFERFCAVAVLLLDIINQPALCHLKVHQPHRGLERALRRTGVGRYPLQAWHEVLIKPQDRPLTQEEVEGHLTGRKCLHFVRSHRRRYRDGAETMVVHHWRGDPALGIKRTRYRVEHGR